MATVHVGRLLGPVGFARTVAIKRLHPQYAADPEFVSMFLDEARMCARIRHPNVVPTLDVVAAKGELFLVMDYVQGESLGLILRHLAKNGEAVPWRVAVAIMAGALHGLHAAHEAKDERGVPLGLVHRDVSPQNILIGSDGMARVVDFGIAKAQGRMHVTREGAVKGKVGYMAPEQMAAETISRQADVYAAAVTLWECLAGRRLFDGETEAVILARVLTAEVSPPSTVRSDIPKEVDDVVMKGLARSTDERFATAREMALALEKLGAAALGEVGEWLETVAGPALHKRARLISLVENGAEPLAGAEPDSVLAPAEVGERSQGSGSIRPTARSEAGAAHEDVPELPLRRPRWKPIAMGLVGVGVLVGAVMALSGSDPPAGAGAGTATSSAVASAATAAQPAGAFASRSAESAPTATAAQGASASTLASSASSASVASASSPVASAPHTSSRPSASPKVTARPTAGKDPFNLGGRN